MMSKEQVSVSSRQAVRNGRSRAVALGAVCIILADPCFAQASSAERTAGDVPAGVMETASGNYEFTPTTCAFHKEGSVDDIEIAGPGTAPDGEVFYFELSSTGNAVSLALGVDKPFTSADRQLQAGRDVSQEFTIDVTDRALAVSPLILVDENGHEVDTGASLRIDCNT